MSNVKRMSAILYLVPFLYVVKRTVVITLEFAYFLFLHSVTIRDYVAYIFMSAPCSANTNSANKIVLKSSASILQTDWRDSLLEWIICVRIFNIYIITHYINTTPSYIYIRIFQGCYSNQLKSAWFISLLLESYKIIERKCLRILYPHRRMRKNCLVCNNRNWWIHHSQVCRLQYS